MRCAVQLVGGDFVFQRESGRPSPLRNSWPNLPCNGVAGKIGHFLAPSTARICASNCSLQQAQSDQAVLDFVKGDQHLRAILRDGLLDKPPRLLKPARMRPPSNNGRLMLGPMLQMRLSQLKISFRSTLSVPGGACQLDGGKESRLGDADAFAGGRHGTFRLGHIRPPFQQIGGQADGNGRRLINVRGFRQRKSGRGLATKGGQGIFQVARAARSSPR